MYTAYKASICVA